MGGCPCPRCLVPKSHTDRLGTKLDQRRRIRDARVDNLFYKVKISSAHEMIHEKYCAVNSTMVDDLLKTESLTPTEVFFVICLLAFY